MLVKRLRRIMFGWLKKKPYKEPLPQAKVVHNKVENYFDILGEWTRYTPHEGSPRDIRTGWCFIPQETEMQMLDPESFCVLHVWGPTEIKQVRVLRENDHFVWSPVMIGNTRYANTSRPAACMGLSNATELHQQR